jgi:hypothetical protein
VPVFDPSDTLVGALDSLGAEQARELLRLLRELVGLMAPGGDLARELAAIAHTARDIFRAQAPTAEAPPGHGDAPERTPPG